MDFDHFFGADFAAFFVGEGGEELFGLGVEDFAAGGPDVLAVEAEGDPA